MTSFLNPVSTKRGARRPPPRTPRAEDSRTLTKEEERRLANFDDDSEDRAPLDDSELLPLIHDMGDAALLSQGSPSHWGQSIADARELAYDAVLGETEHALPGALPYMVEYAVVDASPLDARWPLDFEPDTVRSRDVVASIAVDRAHSDAWPTPTGITRGLSQAWRAGLDEDDFDFGPDYGIGIAKGLKQ